MLADRGWGWSQFKQQQQQQIAVVLFSFLLQWAHYTLHMSHSKRLATQHGYLPRFLGDGDKGIETVDGEEKIILYRHEKPNEPTAEGPALSFVLF